MICRVVPLQESRRGTTLHILVRPKVERIPWRLPAHSPGVPSRGTRTGRAHLHRYLERGRGQMGGILVRRRHGLRVIKNWPGPFTQRKREENGMRYIIALIAISLAAPGCGADVDRPTDSEHMWEAPDPSVTLQLLREESRSHEPSLAEPSPAELQLVDRILADFEPEQQEILRLILFDSVNHHLYTLGSPELDELLFELYDLRSRHDPAAGLSDTGAVLSRRVTERIPTKVVIAESLIPQTATAVIVRSPRDTPANTILLSDDDRSAEGLLSAVMALQRIWKQEGVGPTGDSRYAIRGGEVAATPDLARARKWIGRISSMPKTTTASGRGRSAVVPIGRMEPGSSP